jgi:anthranilate synthase/aminodeoxychorismate synthase-like glutamine amidotransferase
MILLIDNYDSFTYNLKQEIEILGFECEVFRNDKITLNEIRKLSPERIVISPGPGDPDSAGITLDLIREFAGEIPILGVCLGHQAIGQAMGGQVRRARVPMHGKLSPVNHTGKGVFKGIENPVSVVRYHSLVVEKDSIPPSFTITAMSDDGEVMGIMNAELKLEGVQFHPESIATEQGRAMLKNFLTGSNEK